jgi:hypothetical protein
MRNAIRGFAILVALGFAASSAAAQSDILLQLRSGSPAGDRFRVDSAGGFVARGALGIGIIPQSGNGERLMWYPYKGAFRAGGIGSGGTMWDDANIGFYTWAGGFNTTATGLYAFAMGDGSQATNTGSVAFGNDVVSSGQYATALGERTRAASRGTLAVGANCSPVATCTSAHAGTSFRGAPNSNGSSAAIGQYTTADADWSIALGFRASVAGHVGSFVFGGSLAGASAATDSIRSTADGQVTFRNPGGFRIFTNTAATVGVQVNAGGSSWNVISDRNRKHDFLAVDGEDLLSRVATVPVTTWRYNDVEAGVYRHIGPMAQDFARAFDFVSSDGVTINMSDLDGVTFGAVVALESRTRQLQQQLDQRDQRIEALEARLARLEALLAQP